MIQLTGVVARQAHSRSTATLTVPLPPADAKVVAGIDTAASHRDEDGDVTVVEVLAELPHPMAARAMHNSRGARKLTSRLHAQDSPVEISAARA